MLLPTSKLDPTAKFSVRLSCIENVIDSIGDELFVAQETEKAVSGNKDNYITEALNSDITSFQSKQEDLKRKVPFRPQLSQYENLYGDIHHFSQTLAKRDKVLTLMNDLISKGEDFIFGQESLWQVD